MMRKLIHGVKLGANIKKMNSIDLFVILIGLGIYFRP